MRKEIDLYRENCKHFTNHDLDHWLGFTGVKKAQPDFNISDCHYFSAIYYVEEGIIKIRIINRCFKYLNVDVHLAGKYIYLDLIITYEKKIKNASLNIIDGMNKHCLTHGYREIKLLAAGNGIFIGSCVWGKYGFIPTDKEVLEVLDKTILNYRKEHQHELRTEICDLYDLHNLPNGVEMFIRNLNAVGFSGWYGRFVVDPTSRSNEILQDKKNRKGL